VSLSLTRWKDVEGKKGGEKKTSRGRPGRSPSDGKGIIVGDSKVRWRATCFQASHQMARWSKRKKKKISAIQKEVWELRESRKMKRLSGRGLRQGSVIKSERSKRHKFYRVRREKERRDVPDQPVGYNQIPQVARAEKRAGTDRDRPEDELQDLKSDYQA